MTLSTLSLHFIKRKCKLDYKLDPSKLSHFHNPPPLIANLIMSGVYKSEEFRRHDAEHAAFLDTSKIEPGQFPQKFHNRDDRSTFLTILGKKLGAISRDLWS